MHNYEMITNRISCLLEQCFDLLAFKETDIGGNLILWEQIHRCKKTSLRCCIYPVQYTFATKFLLLFFYHNVFCCWFLWSSSENEYQQDNHVPCRTISSVMNHISFSSLIKFYDTPSVTILAKS